MKVFKTKEVKKADEFTILNEPISSINLMERAAKKCYDKLIVDFKNVNDFVVFAGQGNNGGDGLVVARYLKQNNFNIIVYILKISDKFSDDCINNINRYKELSDSKLFNIESKNDFPIINENSIIIDALFGSGLTRPLENLPAELVNYLNSKPNKIVSIDIPSGLFGENNLNNNNSNIIKSFKTYTFQFPKLSFLLADNEDFVSDFEIIDIGVHKDFIDKTYSEYYFTDIDLIKDIYKKRKKYSHKGSYGHSLLISGSYGKMGAAVLSGKACLRAGCGLLTTLIPKLGYEIYQTALPEAMVEVYENSIPSFVFDNISNFNSIAIGPGFGTSDLSTEILIRLIDNFKKPILFDADALNIISKNKGILNNIPKNSILTPHPKEFDRIFGKSSSFYNRLLKQQKESKKNKIIIVLKGAHTSVSMPNGEVYFNSTGNPGMATAGSGDVLTGIILGLLSQKYTAKEASILGVYLHGLSGDKFSKKRSQESLIASDLIKYLSKAFSDLSDK